MDLFLADAGQTHARGIALARELPKGSVMLLSGELGAGKTSLVQGLAAGLGITEAVTSPTFALAQHYSRPDAPQQPVLVHAVRPGEPPMAAVFIVVVVVVEAAPQLAAPSRRRPLPAARLSSSVRLSPRLPTAS